MRMPIIGYREKNCWHFPKGSASHPNSSLNKPLRWILSPIVWWSTGTSKCIRFHSESLHRNNRWYQHPHQNIVEGGCSYEDAYVNVQALLLIVIMLIIESSIDDNSSHDAIIYVMAPHYPSNTEAWSISISIDNTTIHWSITEYDSNRIAATIYSIE